MLEYLPEFFYCVPEFFYGVPELLPKLLPEIFLVVILFVFLLFGVPFGCRLGRRFGSIWGAVSGHPKKFGRAVKKFGRAVTRLGASPPSSFLLIPALLYLPAHLPCLNLPCSQGGRNMQEFSGGRHDHMP